AIQIMRMLLDCFAASLLAMTTTRHMTDVVDPVREDKMRLGKLLYSTVAAIAILTLTTGASPPLRAQQPPAVAIDQDDIGGVVTGPKGPEAGVWVIAETTDLPTRFIRSVVTDDQGRYVIPDLPTANYEVWVRGYGLVDSPRLRAKPGQTLNLAA